MNHNYSSLRFDTREKSDEKSFFLDVTNSLYPKNDSVGDF